MFRVRRVAVRKTVGMMISEWGNGREERNSVYFRAVDDVDEVFVSALEEEEEDFVAQNQGIEGFTINKGNKIQNNRVLETKNYATAKFADSQL